MSSRPRPLVILTEPCDERSSLAAIQIYGRELILPVTDWMSLSARNEMKGSTGLRNSCRVSFGNKIDKGVPCQHQSQL